MTNATIDTARSLLASGARFRPYGCALIARTELEAWIDEKCRTLDAELPKASARVQLLCLPHVVGQELADFVAFTWNALSDACHHHAYELPPSAVQLSRLCDQVETVTDSESSYPAAAMVPPSLA